MQKLQMVTFGLTWNHIPLELEKGIRIMWLKVIYLKLLYQKGKLLLSLSSSHVLSISFLMRTETKLISLGLRRAPLYPSYHFLALQYLILTTDK